MLSRVTLSLLGVVLLVLLHAFLKTILSRVYFFFALFPSPFFGGPFPLLFIRSNFTFRLLSSGSSNSMSIFRIPSGYHDVNRGPTNAFFKSFLPVGAFVSFSAVWNILAATRAIFFLFAEAIDDIALFLLSLFLRFFFFLSSRVFYTLDVCGFPCKSFRVFTRNARNTSQIKWIPKKKRKKTKANTST